MNRLFIFMVFCMSLLIAPLSLVAQNNFSKTGYHITAVTWEIDNANRIITMNENVIVKNDIFTISCDNMVIRYSGTDDHKENNDIFSMIETIIATNHVKIKHINGDTATAERAEFHQDENVIILTGNAVLTRAKSVIKSNKITYFLNEDKTLLKGSKKKPVEGTAISE